MTGPGDIGSDPWDEFLARYFGRGEGGRRPAAPGRHHQADDGGRPGDCWPTRPGGPRSANSSDLDTDHLLWAALQREPLRDLLRRAGADPDTLLGALGGSSGRPARQRGEVPPNLSLTPAAKRALLDAHQLARALGSVVHRPGARPDRAAAQPGLAGRADPAPPVGSSPSRCRPPAPARADGTAPQPDRGHARPSTSTAATSPTWPGRAGSTR